MAYELAGLASPLELVAAVAATGSVTDAARQVGVPQPTASRTLARLSRELGMDLVAADGRGIRMTPEGVRLAAAGEQALAGLRDAVAEIRAGRDAERGRVGLGFLHSMGPVAVPTLLRQFRAAHPGVSIELMQNAADTVLDALIEGRIDLALASPVPSNPALRSRALARQPLVAVLPDGHPLAARARLGIADLARERLITMRPGYGVRTLTDNLARAAGLRLHYVLESDEMSTIAGLVSAGLGVTVLPRGNAAAGTVEVPLRERDAVRVVSLAWSAKRRPSPPVLALRQHLMAHGPAVLRPAPTR